MSETENQKLDYLIRRFEVFERDTREDLGKIKRACYGDPDNKQLGLIDRQIEDEKRIKSLEDHNKRMKWVGTGFFLALQSIGIAVWEYFRKPN